MNADYQVGLSSVFVLLEAAARQAAEAAPGDENDNDDRDDGHDEVAARPSVHAGEPGDRDDDHDDDDDGVATRPSVHTDQLCLTTRECAFPERAASAATSLAGAFGVDHARARVCVCARVSSVNAQLQLCR